MNSVNVRAVDISAAYLGIVDTPFYSLRAEKVLNAFNDSTVQRKLNVEYSWTWRDYSCCVRDRYGRISLRANYFTSYLTYDSINEEARKSFLSLLGKCLDNVSSRQKRKYWIVDVDEDSI